MEELHCPQCGEPTETLDEGYCPECSDANRSAIMLHYAGFDRWERLTPAQRPIGQFRVKLIEYWWAWELNGRSSEPCQRTDKAAIDAAQQHYDSQYAAMRGEGCSQPTTRT